MAMLFLVPRFLWHAFTRQGGLNIRRLVQAIKDKPDAEKGVELTRKTLKIYLGIWIWLIVLTILNILSIILWIVSLTRRRRLGTIKKYLKINRPTTTGEKETLLSTTTTSRAEPVIRTGTYNQFTNYMHLD